MACLFLPCYVALSKQVPSSLFVPPKANTTAPQSIRCTPTSTKAAGQQQRHSNTVLNTQVQCCAVCVCVPWSVSSNSWVHMWQIPICDMQSIAGPCLLCCTVCQCCSGPICFVIGAVFSCNRIEACLPQCNGLCNEVAPATTTSPTTCSHLPFLQCRWHAFAGSQHQQQQQRRVSCSSGLIRGWLSRSHPALGSLEPQVAFLADGLDELLPPVVAGWLLVTLISIVADAARKVGRLSVIWQQCLQYTEQCGHATAAVVL